MPTTFYGTKATFDTKSWVIRPEGAGKDAIGKATQITVEDEGGDHVGNWIDCMVSRRPTNAPIEAGYAHSIASIMCFKSWESGSRQVYDPKDRIIRAG